MQESLVIYILDNYDSFTYNLEHAVRMCGARTIVGLHDQVTADEIRSVQPDGLILSPGPGRPNDAGRMPEIIGELAGALPILGVCLGHQAIAMHFGGELVAAQRIVHGKATRIQHDGKGVFKGLPSPMLIGRYHSLAIRRDSLPDCMEASATTDDNELMAFRHRNLSLEAVQFHPESILTEHGIPLINNFLQLAAEFSPEVPA